MNEVQHTLEVAKGISEYGIMIIICAVFLVISCGIMIACFRWFMGMVNMLMDEQKKAMVGYQKSLDNLEAVTRAQNELLNDLAEGLRTETQLRIRNLSSLAFDLSVEKVCRFIKKMRTENHIDNKEATSRKIRKSLTVMHEDRKSRFDPFTYRGKRLSEYCNDEWIERVAKVVESELYSEENDARADTNVKLAYDDIKTDFYHRLND